ncbi:MAG TPA: type II secretion system protein [Candidatus Aminicenantes bacterium]|nr:type II secretion system protein [Candidatus Aminicenantes bacterium]
MKNKKGLTVVELLLVILFLGIVTAMSLRIGDSVAASSRITGLINNFLADFNAAKLLAATENRYVSITFAADGRSYTLKKQADITNFNAWATIKTVSPLDGSIFFNAGGVSDIAVNSTGEVRLLKSDGTPDLVTPLGTISQAVHIRKRPGGPTDPILYRRTIQIFPYGGLKVEKN